uniref:SEFIR domain-containing protein n=1 Tax=Pseudarthrobacter oxydans TaxID=1671 RepID=UPI003F496A2D
MTESSAPTALVSWAHRDPDWSDHQAEDWITKAVQFANLLMANGVETSLDLWNETDPLIDWTRWGQLQVQKCQLVIILASKAWRQRWEGTNSPDLGAGAVAESDALKGLFNMDQAAFQRKTLLVLLPGVDQGSIPPDLHRVQRFYVTSLDVAGIERLLRRIHGQPLHVKPPLSKAPALPPRSYGARTDVTAKEAIAAKRGELDEVQTGHVRAHAPDTVGPTAAFEKPLLIKVKPGLVQPTTPAVLRDFEADLQLLKSNLTPQGWTFKWNEARTTVRVRSPRGTQLTLKLGQQQRTQADFDRFLRELRSGGARFDSNLRPPPSAG